MEKKDKNNHTGHPRVLRRINLQTVTRRMRQLELFSKIDLARDLGISTTTMTKLFAQLEAELIIEKSPELDSSFGRPKILYQLSPTLQVAAVVIDVEFTHICFSNLQGDIYPGSRISFPTGNDYETLCTRIEKEYITLQKKLKAPCRLIGTCIPGLLEAQSGRSMLNPNLHWMEGRCPAETISEKLHVQAFVMHEEMALNRAQLRSTDEETSYITMDFSAGVGMSVVSNGQPLTGIAGFAGEIGHLIMQPNGKECGCGNHGCLETLASDRVYHNALASKGPVAAAEETIRWQATGIAAVINIFNPEKIFVHSSLAEEHPNYLEKLRRETGKHAISLSFEKCSVQTTHGGKQEGAILLTIDRLIDRLIHAPTNKHHQAASKRS